ncbi:hypothetical protein [Marinobacter adhaerens]
MNTQNNGNRLKYPEFLGTKATLLEQWPLPVARLGRRKPYVQCPR